MGQAFRAFYSDPHIGHANIISHSERPFRDLEHMHEELVRRYNAAIKDDDLVLWCGDALWHPRHGAVIRAMNGRKILVRGNHDRGPTVMSEWFDLVVDGPVDLRICDEPCRVSHYPYRGATPDERYHDRRPERRKGEVLIHGHTHEKERRIGNRVHVGVDAWDYGPALYEDVAALVREAAGSGR